MGAISTAVKHDVHGDAVAIATMDVGTARVSRAGLEREFRAPQSRNRPNTELEVRVGHTGKSEYHHGSFTRRHMSSYQREVPLRHFSSLSRVDSCLLKVYDGVFYQ